MKNNRRSGYMVGLILLVLTGPGSGAEKQRGIQFNRDVRPILSDKCFFCHGPDSRHRKAGLRFDIEESAKEDLGGYRAIEPGKPAKSALVARIDHVSSRKRMPPAKSGKQLTEEEKGILREWIRQGAVYQPHWSYVTPTRPALPSIQDTQWPRNAIDRFILARIEQAGQAPTREASRTDLIRRLCFDLTGLPPTREQLRQFQGAADDQVVDRLLASPHYGERMAILWLDLVRYASTVGYHGDQEHHITPYRDYVIDAFNSNMPYDQFTIEQLAGDLLPDAGPQQKIASGYNRLLQTTHEGGAQDREYLAKYAADRVRNVSEVWMGATMGCAECHNHKFDPYTQEDFYSMAAFFADIKERGAFRAPNSSPTTRDPEMAVLSRWDRQHAENLERRIRELRDRLKSGSQATPEMQKELAALFRERKALDSRRQKTMITVSVSPRPVRALKRGDWMDTTGKIVQPSPPKFLKPLKKGGRATRLDLAQWLTSADHPQTARILVNRLWLLFFGHGLCRTVEDTGSQGQWPTHPALLDWLAMELVENGWDIKHIIRLMVTSSAYRQSSRGSAELHARDPENRLFARQTRYRLPAEAIRDNALSVSGLIVHRFGGGSARPYQPDGYFQHLNFPRRSYKEDQGEGLYRRGVYMHWQRQFLHPMLKAFDAPRREECTSRRPISNTPLGALTLLNDPTFVEAARGLATRAMSQNLPTVRSRIEWLWETVLSRKPVDREVAVLYRLYAKSRQRYDKSPGDAKDLLRVGQSPPSALYPPEQLAPWTILARTILNLNEAITRN